METLIENLICSFIPKEEELHYPPPSKPYLNYTVSDDNINPFEQKVVGDLPLAASDLIYASISSSELLCEGPTVKTMVELNLFLENNDHIWVPGDTIGIFPKNNQQEVEYIVNRLGLKEVAHKAITISVDSNSSKRLPPYIPEVSSIWFLLESCLEIRGILKKGFIRTLAEFTSDPREKRSLLEYCSREGQRLYEEIIVKDRINILDVLKAFPSCWPPFSLLLEYLPRLLPRPYSIASSPLVNKRRARLLFSVAKHNETLGVCTGWLFQLVKKRKFQHLLEVLSLDDNCSNKIPVYFRQPTKFRMPEDIKRPLIMVGPGAGLAPFLGFLEHRTEIIANVGRRGAGETWLYYGCRYNNLDNLYKILSLNRFVSTGALTRGYTSLSRDQDLYVQDSIRLTQSDFVEALMKRNAVLFICGNALNMVKDVRNTLVTCIQQVRQVGLVEAYEILSDLETKGQILTDVWQ